MVKTKLLEFDSIGAEYAELLDHHFHAKYADDFYKLSKEEIINKLPVDEKRVSQWFDVLDLFRVPHITPRDAELLYYVDVNSAKELAHRQATRIFYKLKAVDEDTYLIILQLPTFAEINKWIYYAKLMVLDVKNGLNIPLILFPMIDTDKASEFQKYYIWTVEDFAARGALISNLHRRVGMSKREFADFLNMVKMVMVDGINITMATKFFNSGIKEVSALKELSAEKWNELIGDCCSKNEIEFIKKNILEMEG